MLSEFKAFREVGLAYLSAFLSMLPGVAMSLERSIEYVPIVENAVWEYEGPWSTMRLLSQRALINGVPTSRLRNEFGLEIFVTNDASGFRQHAQEEGSFYEVYDPPITYLPSEFGIGTWEAASGYISGYSVELGNYRLPYYFRTDLTDVRNHTVGETTYRVFRVRTTINVEGVAVGGVLHGQYVSAEFKRYFYFAKGIGITFFLDDYPGDYDVSTLTQTNLDADSDGISNFFDNCVYSVNVNQLDTDGDGLGNVCDEDPDNDGYLDDDFPLDASASLDTDNDGRPDYWNSGQSQADSTTGLVLDVFPLDPSEWADTDGDSVGDNSDNCLLQPNTLQFDSDWDGLGDACDYWNPFLSEALDSPNLEFHTWSSGNNQHWFPTSQFSVEGGTSVASGDVEYASGTIGIGVTLRGPGKLSFQWKVNSYEGQDYLTLYVNGNTFEKISGRDRQWEQKNLELASGYHNLYWAYEASCCVNVASESAYLDAIMFESYDIDGDGVLNSVDNCPEYSNEHQFDTDLDGIGDQCDLDDDNDGLSDLEEAQIETDPKLSDTDRDGFNDGDEVRLGSDPLDPGSAPIALKIAPIINLILEESH